MRFGLMAAFLAALLVVAPQTRAQSWKPVTADQNKSRFDVDVASITPNGGYVQAWVRQILPRRQKSSANGKAYVVELSQRLHDCRARTFAATSIVQKDESGAVVYSTTFPSGEWRFVSPPPGSVADTLETAICEVAKFRATLKPALEIGPTTQADWTPAGFDPQNHQRYFIQKESVTALGGGVVGVIERIDIDPPLQRPDGTLISTSYMAQTFDCEGKRVATQAVDSYDLQGNLVGVFNPPAEKVEVQSFAKGTVPDVLAAYACKPEHIARQAGGPKIFTGTGWLGPKGYIITANHVIDGAAKLELAHEGKVVGEAEVVVADPANDIAVLKPKFREPGHPAILFAGPPAVMGERVFTLGYPAPDVLGVSLKMTSGEVSALAGNDAQTGRSDDARFLQVSIPIHSGNSGGPVIDAQGRAVGIVISKMNKAGEDEVAQNVNYALKIGYVRSLLAELPSIAPSVPLKPQASLSALVGQLKNSIFLVIATTDGGAED